jgi:hypothetical protein
LTIQEAIWHRKPVLGIPISPQEQKNIQRAIDLGFAEAIDVQTFTTAEIVVKIRMLIENPLYLVNIEKIAELVKSSPLGPKQTAVHWLEQVIKHNGLDHLKTEARKMSFYKLYMVDITSFIAIIILIYILIMQYHFIKVWVLKRERKRKDAEDKVMNETDKLKSE